MIGIAPTLPSWENNRDGKSDTPRFGYRAALKYPSGMIVMFDGSTPSMGAHYIYSGNAIKTLDLELQDGGMSILAWHTKQGHKCTRIDLAIDVREDDVIMGKIEQMSINHEWSGTAHSSTMVKSNDGRGSTVYIGSRTSERFVRIYDKAAQLGEKSDWVRIEAEIKSDSARAVARAIASIGSNGLSNVSQSVITRVCNFPCREWASVFDGEIMEIGTPKDTEKNTEKWILGQVAMALAKFERQHPEKRILERLWNEVSDILGE
jgi:hypothetical protein